MGTEPRHRSFEATEISGLEPYLDTVQFRQGACLMHEGSPGDACYFIVSGEVRVEVDRPDFDSNGVVSFMGPGAVCGEFGLLDDSPRSASVYAHTDVVTRRLSAGALRDLCDTDPAAGARMLLRLSRSAAGKARAFSKELEDAGQPDPGQRPGRSGLHRPWQRADALAHPRLRDLRLHLHHRERQLHQPGQH